MFSAALLFALGVLQAAAGPSADTPPPSVVSITAIATDRSGNTVAGLKRDDFIVRDDGRQQAIESVEFKRGTPRLFAILFDEYHIAAGAETTGLRDALVRFLVEQVRSGDQLIAMKPLDPITAIPISSDRDAVRRTVEAFTGCKGDYTARTPFEAEYMSRAPEAAAAERAHVIGSDLTALAARLASVRTMPSAIVFVTGAGGANLRRAVHTAGRAGVPVYVIDVDGKDSDALRTLAIDSGGAYGPSPATAEQVLTKAGRDLDAYYVLTFRATAPADGRFHPVEVATRRRNVQVQARRGYWSALPPVRRASGLAGSFPMSDLLAAHASNLIQPWFRISRGPEGRTRITFSWQPAGTSRAAHAAIPEIVHLTAATPDGTAVFRGTVAATQVVNGSGGAAGRIVMDVPPGRLRTEMNISDGGDRVLDRDIRFLEVPNLYSAGIVITTPEILRSMTALQFRELAADLNAPPTFVREFNRFERLLIRVRAYGPGDALPAVSATLVNALGQRLRDIVRVADGGDGTVQFDLPLAMFARGNYSIEIFASAGGRTTSHMIPILVIG